MDSRHSRIFGRLLVQDSQGRIKPVNSLAYEFLHTLGGGRRPLSLKPDQMALGLFVNPDAWKHIPMIPVKDPMIRNVLGVFVKDNKAAYLDFFNAGNGSYKLASQVHMAREKPPNKQDALDEELIRLDWLLHECSRMFRGTVFQIFPMPGDTAKQWLTYRDVM